MSGTEWTLFAGCMTAIGVFFAAVVWSVAKVAGWMKGGRDD